MIYGASSPGLALRRWGQSLDRLRCDPIPRRVDDRRFSLGVYFVSQPKQVAIPAYSKKS